MSDPGNNSLTALLRLFRCAGKHYLALKAEVNAKFKWKRNQFEEETDEEYKTSGEEYGMSEEDELRLTNHPFEFLVKWVAELTGARWEDLRELALRNPNLGLGGWQQQGSGRRTKAREFRSGTGVFKERIEDDKSVGDFPIVPRESSDLRETIQGLRKITPSEIGQLVTDLTTCCKEQNIDPGELALDAVSPGTIDTGKGTLDIITSAAACKEFAVSRSVLKNRVKDGSLTDHRPPKHHPNATLQLDRAELAEQFSTRRSK